MAFSLPDNLSTSWVDDSSTIHGSDWNNITTMGMLLNLQLALLVLISNLTLQRHLKQLHQLHMQI